MMAESGQNCRHLHGKVGFSGGSADKESACNVGDLRSIPELGRSPKEGNSYPLQYSGLKNSMDQGALQATVQWHSIFIKGLCSSLLIEIGILETISK